MDYKQLRRSSSSMSDKSSIIFWLIMILFLIIMVIYPFEKGIFNGGTSAFEGPIYSFLIWSGLLLCLLSIYLIINKELLQNNYLLVTIVWLLPLSYLLSHLNSVSKHLSQNMVLISSTYAIFFIFGLLFGSHKIGSTIIKFVLLLSGYSIVFFGFINFFGHASYQDAVMGAGLTFKIRLNSVFQYAPTYAAYLISLLFLSINLFVSSNKLVARLGYSFMLIPIFLSLLLTYSRGALVIIPFLIIIFICFMNIRKQLEMLLVFFIVIIISFLILDSITEIGVEILQDKSSTLSIKGWIILTIASLVTCIFSVFINLAFDKIKLFIHVIFKIEKYKFASFILPTLASLIGAVIITMTLTNSAFVKVLPTDLQNIVSNINFKQNSVLERGTFYSDSMKLLKDYPFFGAGGGAWSTLYQKYQNNPYVSRQAHNFYLQYLVEVGIFGFFIFISFILLIFILFVKNYISIDVNAKPVTFTYFLISLPLLLHSLIDFDMSFIFLTSIVFICLGGIASGLSKLHTSTIKKLNLKFINYLLPTSMILLALYIVFISTQYYKATSYYQAAFAATQVSQSSFDQINIPLEKALSINPHHPEYLLLKINLLFQISEQNKQDSHQSDINRMLEQFKQSDAHNRNLLDLMYYYQIKSNNLDGALKIINDGLIDFTWDINLYETKIMLLKELGNNARIQKQANLKNKYWNEAISVYDLVIKMNKYLKTLPEGQQEGRPFSITNKMNFSMGQIEFINGNYPIAADYFSYSLSDNLTDPINREMARWYLASLHKQGLDNKDLYNKLVSLYPNEKEEIMRIITSNFN